MAKKKVIVWAPGAMGQAAIRELQRIPELELAGVLAYSEDKNGKDVSELIGGDPTGITITTDKEAIFAMPADCVIHTAAPLPDITMYDDDVVRLLESGKNVISISSYHFSHLYGPERVAKLEAACRKGKSTLHGTGIHPSFVFERVGLTATGLSNRIEHVRIREIVSMQEVQSQQLLMAFGFGLDPNKDVFADDGMVSMLLSHYYKESLNFFAYKVFGKLLDRVEKQSSQGVAEEDIPMRAMTISTGKVARTEVTYTGYIDDKPRVTMQEQWYAAPKYCPVPGMEQPHYWDVEVEGEPVSLRLRMETFVSVKNNTQHYENDPTMVPYYASVTPAIQSIARVCEAEPGLLYQDVFAHSRPDLSVVGTPIA